MRHENIKSDILDIYNNILRGFGGFILRHIKKELDIASSH